MKEKRNGKRRGKMGMGMKNEKRNKEKKGRKNEKKNKKR